MAGTRNRQTREKPQKIADELRTRPSGRDVTRPQGCGEGAPGSTVVDLLHHY